MGLTICSRSGFCGAMSFKVLGPLPKGLTEGSDQIASFGRLQTVLARFVSRAGVYLAMVSFTIFGLTFIGAGVAEAQWPLGKELTVQDTKAESGTSVTGTGRFQIFVSPQAKGYTFMLDSDTGRVWVLKRDHTAGEFSFHRIQVEQVDPQTAKGQSEKTEKPDKTKAPESNK